MNHSINPFACGNILRNFFIVSSSAINHLCQPVRFLQICAVKDVQEIVFSMSPHLLLIWFQNTSLTVWKQCLLPYHYSNKILALKSSSFHFDWSNEWAFDLEPKSKSGSISNDFSIKDMQKPHWIVLAFKDTPLSTKHFKEVSLKNEKKQITNLTRILCLLNHILKSLVDRVFRLTT